MLVWSGFYFFLFLCSGSIMKESSFQRKCFSEINLANPISSGLIIPQYSYLKHLSTKALLFRSIGEKSFERKSWAAYAVLDIFWASNANWIYRKRNIGCGIQSNYLWAYWKCRTIYAH